MMAPLRIAALFFLLGFPVLELAVLIAVGNAIGFWPTFGLLVAAAVAGMLVIRAQGVSMVGRMFDTIGRGGVAFATMVDSYFVILAGFLLIVPGFITDALGIALLIPPLRRLLLGIVLPGFADARRNDPQGPRRTERPSEASRPVIIEGTYERIDENDPRH